MLTRYHLSPSQLEYVIYRRVLRYYSGEEDGLGKFPNQNSIFMAFYGILIASSHIYQIWAVSDMRKALSRDVEKKSIIPLKRPVTPDELEYD